jgi:hypothetical protein
MVEVNVPEGYSLDAPCRILDSLLSGTLSHALQI